MKLRFILAFALAAITGTLSHAQDYKLKDLHIGQPYARATVPNQPSGAAYLSLENKGKESDRLVGVSSPVAKSAEIHAMTMDGNVMRMREVENIELKPGEKIEMKPGQGYHLMLMGLHQPLKAGDKILLTLIFEKAGKAEVSATVQDANKKAAGDVGSHRGH